jgi:hypothetical protein
VELYLHFPIYFHTCTGILLYFTPETTQSPFYNSSGKRNLRDRRPTLNVSWLLRWPRNSLSLNSLKVHRPLHKIWLLDPNNKPPTYSEKSFFRSNQSLHLLCFSNFCYRVHVIRPLDTPERDEYTPHIHFLFIYLSNIIYLHLSLTNGLLPSGFPTTDSRPNPSRERTPYRLSAVAYFSCPTAVTYRKK